MNAIIRQLRLLIYGPCEMRTEPRLRGMKVCEDHLIEQMRRAARLAGP